MLVIRGARLFDGLAARPGRPSVFVEDGRIIAVDLAGAEPPTDATVVDLGEVTLLPGLVDAHVHLCFDPATDPVRQMLAGDVRPAPTAHLASPRTRCHREQHERAAVRVLEGYSGGSSGSCNTTVELRRCSSDQIVE